mgnify:CR=1 FL=1
METTAIYFSVKILSATYILYKIWMFIFSQKVHEFWDRQHCYMRIARVRLWKFRKKRMAEKAWKTRYKARLKKADERMANAESESREIRQEKKTEIPQGSPVDDNDVIGKTKIVYLEDPEVARKTPTRSEPLKKEPIEKDEDINPDDVMDDSVPQKGLTEAERQELLSNNEAIPDPDFSKALTFDELNNVADVLLSGTDNKKKIQNAVETLYHLQDTDLFKFFSTELSTQNQLEKLLKENLNPTQKESNGKDMAQQSVKQACIDWNKYM